PTDHLYSEDERSGASAAPAPDLAEQIAAGPARLRDYPGANSGEESGASEPDSKAESWHRLEQCGRRNRSEDAQRGIPSFRAKGRFHQNLSGSARPGGLRPKH